MFILRDLYAKRFVVADIWIISDGKPGHINQSLGLVEALLEFKPNLTFKTLPLKGVSSSLFATDRPKLIISAGRATHFWNWALTVRFGAKNVVLMRPSLPYSFFNLALVPEHDAPPAFDRVVTTKGAINRMKPSKKQPESRLVLLGGPSKHVIWDDARIIEQIDQLTEPSIGLLNVATSRRTPNDLLQQLRSKTSIRLIEPDSVDSDWLPSTLATTEQVIVSSDSVSMVYEALTAGCTVSLIRLESTTNSRTQQGIDSLVEQGLVGATADQKPANPVSNFREAARCAEIILERFPL
nr:ELM1/GtrOC1 family putative glycosyltransferase [Marinobacterium sp. xm-d-564]